ncbi:SAM-dependent methyltransferase [Actinoplanes sp. Pm04-4]|uniref:SAM-dependent methyltransferase n=1 Tax=Paractinoplanes pyxinae TaxID=2997416 RepID=A0ABT4B4Q4_9ACTN|nr:SAM-dependent methyltransferase [Actinoplanes pyxinae]MCY1141489.1 SAM-dependent methyltransferase [Actinoplanes pyxinae]
MTGVDQTTPDPARRYNVLLGGKDNFAADRESAAAIQKEFSSVAVAARENRAFMLRAVHHLAADRGIRQFLDIGVGMPMATNLHEVAQRVDPACRILYVDHEPMVAAHARALLTSTPEGKVAFAEADLRDPDTILDHARTGDTLDMNQPIALVLAAVLHFCTDQDDPYAAVRTLVDALPSGSYLVISHATFDPLPDDVRASLTALAAPGAGHGPFQARTRAQVATFFDGLDIEEPGIVSTVDWHPNREPRAEGEPHHAICYAAIGKRP